MFNISQYVFLKTLTAAAATAAAETKTNISDYKIPSSMIF
jgi:hypothetical protein